MEVKIQRELKADVAVVGGGTAGVFAAIAAAKSGAKTILIEKNSILGGTMTAACVNFPGLFFAWGKQIIAGPCWEAIEKTIELGGAKMPQISFKPERHWHEQILVNRFVYTAVITGMCRDAGVIVISNAMLADAQETETGVELLISEKTGLSRIFADNAIDATGDANLAQICGFELAKSEKQQPATLQNHLSGYDIGDVERENIKKALERADFPDEVTENKLFDWLNKHKIDYHVPCSDADTSEGRTKLEGDALSYLLKIYSFLKKIKGLENLTVDFIAEETGVRETNRIVGEKVVTAEEYISGKIYPDAVCYAFYPIDLHVMSGIEQTFFEENKVGCVPYGALVPKSARHVLCAGRCISSDSYANSALRVEAVCMADGQAAGCAAAAAAKSEKNVGDVPYSDICAALEKMGAIIPKK